MLKLKVASWIRTVLDRIEARLRRFHPRKKLGSGKPPALIGTQRPITLVHPLGLIIRTTPESAPDRSDEHRAFVRFCRIRFLKHDDDESYANHWLELDQESRHRK